ncbi:Calcium-binding protein 39 [Podochytrium sp. JEL0797]|nr:Calcium-binding protein 39 [Podochytrium sp. JEL0797]
MFGFSRAKKSPLDLVRGTKESIARLGLSDKLKDISKNLVAMKAILYGDGVADPSPELVAQLSHEVYNNDILPLLIGNIWKLEFEVESSICDFLGGCGCAGSCRVDWIGIRPSPIAKKDVSQIFNNLLRRQIGTRFPTAEYVAARPDILKMLMAGYENQDIALHCGMILRECIRHEILAKQILDSPNFWKFFEYVELPTFDVASDAFQTFKDLLTKHKAIVSEFLANHYDEFFEKFSLLLNSSNYVTKRQSLKLLGEILLDRTNYTIMTQYIGSTDNLKLMMILLRDKSRNIQFEAFHVFKVFVANPNKTKPILDILQRNKDKLAAYLTQFHNDRADDETFADEKAFLVKAIQEL